MSHPALAAVEIDVFIAISAATSLNIVSTPRGWARGKLQYFARPREGGAGLPHDPQPPRCP